MRILLIHPPLRVNRDHIDYPLLTSLAVWQNAAHLEAAGFAVRVVDAFSLPGAARTGALTHFRLGADLKKVLAAIGEAPFDAAVVRLDPFTVQDAVAADFWAILQHLREIEPKALVVLADLHIGGMNYVGYDPSYYFKHLHAPDLLVRFEGETALTGLFRTLAAGKPLPYPKPAGLNGPPLPAPLSTYGGRIYRQADLSRYRAFLKRALAGDGRPNPFKLDAATLPFKSSRGCCFSCRFCTSAPGNGAGMRREWRPADPAELAAEVAAVGRMGAVKKLWVLDEAANLSPARFDGLLAAAEKAGLALEFPNGLRADRLTEGQIRRLAPLISLLSLSPESGSDDGVARLVGKHQLLAAVERAARRAYAAKLPVALHFIVGLPGETRAETSATFAYARRMYEQYGAEPWVQFAVALPGTPLFDQCEQEGLLPKPLPRDFGPLFQRGPMLKDGACEVANGDLVRMKTALERRGRGIKTPNAK